MSKLEQALLLEPATELFFKGPYSSVTTSYLKLSNPTDRCIGFKVKTTAPKTYCVRPNGGVIQPKESVSVAVMLQPCDVHSEERRRDKFMVQSVYVPLSEKKDFYVDSFDTFWSNPDAFMNSKLKCTFNLPVPKPPEEAASLNINYESAPDSATTKENVAQESKSSATDAEAKRLIEEYNSLKEEMTNLRIENSNLKRASTSLKAAAEILAKTSPKPPVEKPPLPNYLIVVSVIILILGVCMGKYIL